MQVKEKTILNITEAHVRNFFEQHIAISYTYHDLQHTINVVTAVKEIASFYDLKDNELELLVLSAWFHDLGYDKGPERHEERGAAYANRFLKELDYADESIVKIENCILATKYPQAPATLLEEILCDADLSHLGKDIYWDRCSKVRQELAITKDLIMDEQAWINFELDFMLNQQFHTAAAKQLYDKAKQKHVRQLVKQKARINPNGLNLEELTIIETKAKGGKKKKKAPADKEFKNQKKELKQLRLGRGVETMFRTTYRTHVNLSSIADNKANIMLSINAIIISITVSTLVPNFSENPKLIIPTLILLIVCLTSIVFATLSTMPKVTQGVFTREDIKKKRSNLLFFGNFYNMKIDDFHWGMMEMIKDSDFLYSSMTRDLYFLGKVLAKKYDYLRYCYRVFMYGLITAVIAFALSFLF